MKLVIVYNPNDNKTRADTYSYIYRGMLDAVVEKFNPVYVSQDCNADSIDADVILFWDVNSCHHIYIKGIEKHSALKIEYISDPPQKESVGIYKRYNMPVHKLGAKQRIYRLLDRGVKYIICPTKKGFWEHYAPILGEERAEKMFMYFPQAPWFESGKGSLSERKQEVLANGSVSNDGIGYDFRYWAFQRPNITFVKHYLSDNSIPMGKKYGEFLKQWAGGLALCDTYPVVKYYEMPLAGCVTFMSYHEECEGVGFKDYETCVYVTKDNFDERIKDFVNDIPSYQNIANKGRELVEKNYTAKHFAEFLERKIIEELYES